LLEAIRQDDIRAVRTLLDQGADPRKISGHWGQEPLCDAASDGQIEIMRALLEKGVDADRAVCCCSGSGWGRTAYPFPLTPLTLAALTGHGKAVRFLADRGADLQGGIATMERQVAVSPGRTDYVAALILLKKIAATRELSRPAPPVKA
jgi:ankyrin repeat protein